MTEVISALGTPEFQTVLKSEIQSLDCKQLPLQQGLTNSSIALDGNIHAVILNVKEDTQQLQIKAGIFYTGIIGGCACTGDPAPEPEQSEYCEVLMKIDKLTAETHIALLDGQVE